MMLDQKQQASSVSLGYGIALDTRTIPEQQPNHKDVLETSLAP